MSACQRFSARILLMTHVKLPYSLRALMLIDVNSLYTCRLINETKKRTGIYNGVIPAMQVVGICPCLQCFFTFPYLGLFYPIMPAIVSRKFIFEVSFYIYRRWEIILIRDTTNHMAS